MIFRPFTLSLLAAAFLASASPAFAQEDGRQFSAQSGEAVNEALTLANSGDTKAAIARLKDTISAPDLKAYERSTIYQMLGQYSYAVDRPLEAQAAFEKAIAAGGLLPDEAEAINIVITQLMIGNGDYRQGAERLEAYLDAGGQAKPQYIDLLVNAWVQAEDYSRALPWAEKWFAAAAPKQRRHFDLMNFLYNDLGQAGQQADIVRQMIDRWPDDKGLWENYASMLANGGREKDAFEVTKIMYLKNMLTTETELLKVVQYYSFYDMPFQAAQILEKEMDASRISRAPENLKQLAGLYRQAREYKRAIPILEATAGLSGTAETFAELGEALYNEGDCRKSELAFNEAMRRGYDAGKSWMLIASCRYDSTVALERLNCKMTEAEMAAAPITKARQSAIEAFGKVPRRSGEAKNAATWIQFIETEKDAVKLRCDFEDKVHKDGCFKAIDQAYKAVVLAGEFKLDDESCEKHVAEYDVNYRQGAASE